MQRPCEKGVSRAQTFACFFYMHAMFHITIVALDIIVVLINTVVIKFMYCFRIFSITDAKSQEKH